MRKLIASPASASTNASASARISVSSGRSFVRAPHAMLRFAFAAYFFETLPRALVIVIA
jgi:hypothetical protein